MKDKLAQAEIAHIADCLRQVLDEFDSEQFTTDANRGLSELELKQRVAHIIDVLAKYLPQDFEQTAVVLQQLKSVWGVNSADDGWQSFAAWPVIDYIGVYGLEYPNIALPLLAELTSLFSAEFAIRPYLEQHFKLSYDYIHQWTQHSDEHIRRLASEGIRPRLPWAKQIDFLTSEPATILPILEQLKNDTSLYVRKSVANNLNDISKNHPDLVIELCKKWQYHPTSENQWIIKQSLRSLIKQGDVAALQLLGYQQQLDLELVDFALTPTHVQIGQSLEIELQIESRSNQAQKLVIDYKVHHVKANGTLTAKVFKWKQLLLEGGKQVNLNKRHPIKRISTRKYYAGTHYLELIINGVSLEKSSFELLM